MGGKRIDPARAEKVMLQVSLKPLEPFQNVGTKWKCKCLVCGDIVYPRYANIKNGHKGCLNCSNLKKVTQEVAEILLLNSGFQPLEPYTSYQTPWKSKCITCGKLVFPSYGNLKKKKMKCPYCAKNKVDEIDAINVMLKSNLQPLEPYKTALSKWKCKCLVCESVVYPKYGSVHKGQGGCTFCGRKMTGEKLKRDADESVAIMLKAGLKPLEPYIDIKTKWKCKCLKCGNIVNPMFNSIQSGSGGCNYCKKVGFNHSEAGYFYIIWNDELNSIKVGIGNPDSRPDRIKSYLKIGWQLYKKYDFSVGNQAWEIEVATLRWLRKDRKLPQHLTIKEMRKKGGQSETVCADSITALEIKKKVDQLIKGLQK